MAEGRESKRRKTLLACEYCRNKKTKCDGRRPVCGACAKRGWTQDRCMWRYADGKEDVVSLTLVQGLERRIQELERQRGAVASSQIIRPSMTTSSLHANSPDLPQPSPSSISAMEGAVTGEHQTEGFVGPAAAAAFMDTVRRAVDPQPLGGRIAPRPHLSREHLSFNSPNHVLPVPREANVLVRAYWIYVHPIYPCLHKPAFEAIYESLWSGQPVPVSEVPLMQTARLSNICLVNLVLVLGCQYSIGSGIDPGVRHGSQQAAIYFERAQLAFYYDPLSDRAPSLQQVQVLLLMVQYLKSIGSTQKAWDLIGPAIRMCQRLGLHIPAASTSQTMTRFSDREIVRRVWHGCVMVERMLSATLGRPAMVAAADVVSTPFPSEVDEDLFQSSGSESTSSSGQSAITFFILSIKLFELVQRILQAFYSDSPSDASSDYTPYLAGTDSVLSIDSQMLEWHRSIPSYLRLGADYASQNMEDAAGVFKRQASILKIRYLQARIYLFRPILSQACIMHRTTASEGAHILDETKSVTTLPYRVAIQCSLLCIAEAVDLIETMYANHTTAEAWGQKPSWLYGVLHIYLAATVLLAARLAPEILLVEISEERFQLAWNRALAILQGFQADSVSAQRCVSSLETLARKLPIAGNHGHRDFAFSEADKNDRAYFATPVPTASSDEWPSDTQELSFDFDLSDPYDMSWFMTSESFI
ncbi:C6 transcription factor [Stagonosporopsis vannaccii]|nr:C6 transcription factor [Stagonosporopsis vannaccii]